MKRHQLQQILGLLGTALLIVGIVYLIKAGNVAQHAANQLSTGAAQAAQQISTIEQNAQAAQQQAVRATWPPEGSKCVPKGGGPGVIVYSPSGPECVWQ